MIKAKKEERQEIWRYWDKKNSDFAVLFEYQTKRAVSKINDICTVEIKGSYKGKKDATDFVKVGELFTLRAVKDWKGFTYKNLIEICENISTSEPLNTAIGYSQENLEFVAKNQNNDFSMFILGLNSEFASFKIQEKEEEELKNSKPGQTGS